MNKQKGSVQVWIIVIVLIIVAVGGYFYLKSTKSTQKNTATTPAFESSRTTQTPVTQTPAYSSYTSPDGVLTIQYRSDLFIAKRSGVDDVLRYTNDPNGLAFAIFSFANSEYKSYSSYICGNQNSITEGSISAGKTRTCTDSSSKLKSVYTFIEIGDSKTLSVSAYPKNDSELQYYNQAIESIVVHRDKLFK